MALHLNLNRYLRVLVIITSFLVKVKGMNECVITVNLPHPIYDSTKMLYFPSQKRNVTTSGPYTLPYLVLGNIGLTKEIHSCDVGPIRLFGVNHLDGNLNELCNLKIIFFHLLIYRLN